MDLQARIKDAEARLRLTVEKINALADERERLLQEALRIEGEVRLLKQMEAEPCEPTSKKEA